MSLNSSQSKQNPQEQPTYLSLKFKDQENSTTESNKNAGQLKNKKLSKDISSQITPECT